MIIYIRLDILMKFFSARKVTYRGCDEPIFAAGFFYALSSPLFLPELY